MIYHHRSNFYQQNNLNQTPEFFFSAFVSGVLSNDFYFKAFCYYFHSYIKTFFGNLLNSGVVKKPIIPGISFLISMAFVLRVALVARFEMSGILLSISAALVLRATVVTSNNLTVIPLIHQR